MGKKATSYLIYVITIYVTIALCIFSIIAWYGQHTDPAQNWFPALVGLAIAPLLIIDFVLLIFWALIRKLWVIIPLVAIAINFNYIGATFQPRFTTQEQHDLKTMTYNVHNFKYGNFRITVESMALFMKNESVDIACFQEFASHVNFNIDSIKKTFDFLPYSYIIHKNGRSLNLAVFSKYPIIDSAMVVFHGSENSAMWVDILVNGKTLRVINTHLQTTNINQSQREIDQLKTGVIQVEGRDALYTVTDKLRANFTQRSTQAQQMLNIIDRTTTPLIVCGDFNDTPISYVYTEMTKNLNDGFRKCGSGYEYTYNAFSKLLRIDYILYNDRLEGTKYYSSNQYWSDHNPVLLELRFRD